MKSLRQAAIALFAGFVLACSPATEPITDGDSSAEAALATTISQKLSKGDVRTDITITVLGAYGYQSCFGPETIAEIVSATQALNLMKAFGIDKSTSIQSAFVIDQLGMNSSLTAVEIQTQTSTGQQSALWIPDMNDAGRGYMFDLVSPSKQETCVSCTEYVGQLAGKGCNCRAAHRRVCGQNPSATCTSECSYCPNEGSNEPAIAGGICGFTTPFVDSASYSVLSPGQSL